MARTQKESIALLLGAGFSHCAGMPLQAQFSNRLFASTFNSELDRAITSALKTFTEDTFGWRERHAWPSLEDIFTCIDLSASTGHHLGIKYTPKVLRALRRMAIYRIFSILDEQFHFSEDISALLNHSLNGERELTGIVVLNWDIVLEKHLARIGRAGDIDYCCGAFDWNLYKGDGRNRVTHGNLPVCKVHGSSNWVYCENCTALFYNLDEKLSLRSKVGLIKHDFRLFEEHFSGKHFNQALGIKPKERKCRRCKNMVSSHIATFSYRKSFRTYAYSVIWHRAAQILADASHWIFVGYSLPHADFELKHLIKSAQLRYAHIATRPRRVIDVIVKGEASRGEYEGFFGRDTIRYFGDGLEGYVSSSVLSSGS